jgi:mercuric ion transport protein
MLEKVLAGGGVAAALAASTCCVLPLSLAAVGVSTAWLANLSALAPFQLGFRLLAVLLLGAGFWMVYGRPAKITADQACAAVPSQQFAKATLWFGLLLMTLVLTSGWWLRYVA